MASNPNKIEFLSGSGVKSRPDLLMLGGRTLIPQDFASFINRACFVESPTLLDINAVK